MGPPVHRARRRLARALALAGLAMAPWLLVLHSVLPSTTRVTGWSTAWMGLDGLEGVGLLVTSRLLCRCDARASITAAMTSAVLLVDAWFDVSTAGRGASLVLAVAMAVVVELPASAACLAIALRELPASA